jgi:predicted nucleic acid-binding protein
MIGKTFIDSNVLIYAHDLDAGRKRDVANAALRRLWDDRSGVLSLQVLQEFYVNVTRKIPKPLERPRARRVVDTYAAWCIETTPSDIAVAFRIEDESRIGFWDALIVSSAVKSGAGRILSEDLRTGQRIGGILIENPFDVAT